MRGFLLDTNILIEFLKGNKDIAEFIEREQRLFISVISIFELLRGARDKRERKTIKQFAGAFEVIHLTQEISKEALTIFEGYYPRYGVGILDSLIAASAKDRNLQLITLDRKHFAPIKEVNVWIW